MLGIHLGNGWKRILKKNDEYVSKGLLHYDMLVISQCMEWWGSDM